MFRERFSPRRRVVLYGIFLMDVFVCQDYYLGYLCMNMFDDGSGRGGGCRCLNNMKSCFFYLFLVWRLLECLV